MEGQVLVRGHRTEREAAAVGSHTSSCLVLGEKAVLYLAPHTPGGLQVVLVDLVDSSWSPPGFHKNSHITTEFSGVHLESTWSLLESIWTPIKLHMNFTKILDKCYKVICTL